MVARKGKTSKKDAQGAMDFSKFMANATKGAVIDLNNRKSVFYGTGDLKLDKALGGGMPAGQVWSIYGQQSSGKSLVTLGICRSVIETGGRVAYFDTENKISKKAIDRTGLSTATDENGAPLFNHFTIEDNNLEDMIDQMMQFAESGFFKLIVVDSVDQLTTDETIEKDTHDIMRVGGGGKAQRWAEYMPSIIAALERSTEDDDGVKCSLMLVRQVRDALNSYAPGAVRTAGGKALDHSITTVLMTSPNKDLNAYEDDLLVYQGIKIRVQKTNEGATPKEPLTARLYIGPDKTRLWGIDPMTSLIAEAVEMRVIPPKNATSHYYIPCDELCEMMGWEPGSVTYNGMKNLTAAVTNDKELADVVRELVQKRLDEGFEEMVEDIEFDEENAVEFEELD